MFLEVQFSDNDFGLPLVAALKRLWGWVHKNNTYMIVAGFSARTVPQMFEELHKAEVLEGMIKRLFVCETLAFDIEFATRGLAEERINTQWIQMTKRFATISHKELDKTQSYLQISVCLHDTNDFTKEWQNAEHAWLNLETGEADTF